MTLTDAQLGRIARALADCGESMFVVLEDVVDGQVAQAIERVHQNNSTGDDELLSVLREVAAEVEQERRRARRGVIEWDTGLHYGEDAIGDSRWLYEHSTALDDAVRVIREQDLVEAFIRNAADGTEWTWKRESER